MLSSFFVTGIAPSCSTVKNSYSDSFCCNNPNNNLTVPETINMCKGMRSNSDSCIWTSLIKCDAATAPLCKDYSMYLVEVVNPTLYSEIDEAMFENMPKPSTDFSVPLGVYDYTVKTRTNRDGAFLHFEYASYPCAEANRCLGAFAVHQAPFFTEDNTYFSDESRRIVQELNNSGTIPSFPPVWWDRNDETFEVNEIFFFNSLPGVSYDFSSSAEPPEATLT